MSLCAAASLSCPLLQLSSSGTRAPHRSEASACMAASRVRASASLAAVARALITTFGVPAHLLAPRAHTAVPAPPPAPPALLTAQYVAHFNWDRRLEMLHDVAAGMSYLHGKDHVHGDLRSPNLFVGADSKVRGQQAGRPGAAAKKGAAGIVLCLWQLPMWSWPLLHCGVCVWASVPGWRFCG